ncbi:hypothetical protein GCM10027425_09280 [Alteromonas gracilis]
MGRPATLRVDIVTDAKKVGPGVDQADSKLGRLSGTAKKVGLAVGAGLAVAGAAAVKIGYDTLQSASRVQQSMGALETVYGRNAGQVKKWASAAAESVGLAKSEYAELSSLIGSQLQGMGVAQGESAKKSNDLIKIGADLAATYGGTAKEAVEALSSALRGETDPIERYGISLKASDVAAKKAALGLEGLTGKADKQATATASLALIQEAGARSTGAFARESNTLAGQQQRLSARFENLKATLGEKLLPIATKALGWANKMMPAVFRLGGQLGKSLAPAVRGVGRFITTTLVPAGRRLYAWFVEKIAPGIRRTVTPIVNGLKSAFASVRNAVDGNGPALARIQRVLGTVIAFMYRRVYPIVGRVLGGAFRGLGAGIGVTIRTVSALSDGIAWLVGKVRDLIDWLRRFSVPAGLSKIADAVGLAAAPVTTGRPALSGLVSSYDTRRAYTSASTSLATAAGGTAAYMSSIAAAGSMSPARGGVVIDARTYVQVDGALDADSVARQFERIMRDRDRRLGRR